MDAKIIESLGMIGATAAISLSAIGSALGTGVAGMAAIGAWKKCYAQGKAATFLLLAFVGAPLSQTIYGMILMFVMKTSVENGAPFPPLLGAGIFGGLAIGISAWFQGKAGAAGAHALAETEQGFTNYLAVLGVVETVAIFVMVFLLLIIQ
ncbi:MAG: V-type ATP synthase subunit K [Lentisphaerae bacterium]|nr:V-type ATP synthase subunit K [Lentisphaerota bacterium]